MVATKSFVDVELQGNALQFMRRVRWLGAIFALVQFWLYEPPAGLTVPFDQMPTGILLAGCLIVLNVGLWSAERRRHAPRSALVLLGLFCDAAIVFGVVWLFRFDTTSALWGLLVIPVLEAAVAAQMAGALAMWAALTVGYIVREADTAANYDYAIFEVPSITFRMGIVLIVATTAGSLARSLTQEVRAQRAARLESQQRARLLHGLALSSQALLKTQTETDPRPVWDAVVSVAIDVGFDGASMMVVDPDRENYLVVCGRGLPDGYVGTRHPIGTGISGEVWARGEIVLVEDYSTWSGASPAFDGSKFGASAAVPIRREGEVVAVLVAALREPGVIPVAERECIELLAVHAGVALNNVAHSAERARYEHQLTEIAYTDSLTALPNRDVFMDRLTELMAAKERPAAAVLFIDLDRFKTVNDSLGHHGGDELLVELSRRLVQAAHPHLVTRFGGDEFTVLLEDVGSIDDARAHAAHLMQAMSEPLHIDGQEIVPSVSVGIRFTQAGETQADVVLRDADSAMYQAKKLGRHRVEVFDPRSAIALPALTLEAEMRHALQAGEFEVHFQPVVSLPGRLTTSVEALLRWHHPQRGLISPADFIPLAEDSGFIVQLGRWVLEQACAQAAAWRAGGHELDVAVNVSVVQLQHSGLLDDITAALQHSGLCPSQLILEITESATVTDPSLMLAQARRIRGLGVRLALDDFGQGTTSLRFLRRLPLDILKIDKSFVDDLLPTSSGVSDQAAVVRSVIQMAHDLGLTVTAEGVEDAGQMMVLRQLGCDHAQGYLLGRPAPAATVTALLDEAALDEVRA